MATITDLRPSPIAGLWYEGNPEKLGIQIDRYLATDKITALTGEVIGLIVPHAGHRYSGRTAGYAFGCARGMQRELVVIVSPMHSYSPVPLLTSAHLAYVTPLGKVEIDRSAVGQLSQILKEGNCEEIVPIPNDREHSLEIELPFIQRAMAGTYKLLPVMMHTHDAKIAHDLGLALGKLLKNRSSLLIASTDLSHFYSQQIAAQLDSVMLNQIAAFSPEGVLNAERNGTGFACGATAVAAVLWAAKELGADHVEILHHSTSAEETGDYDSVVGYGAGVILKHS